MEQNDQNEIDLNLLTIQEVYALRSRAREEDNKPLLNKIYLFLNGRSGGFGETLESLLAKRQQFKEDFEAGKITPEEYKKYLDDFHAANNCPIRNNFNQRYGATGIGRQYIEAGKLYRGNENILVLVPHGTPEDLNAYSLQFWHLQEILNNADFQEDPDTSDTKNPEYVLMDPTFSERYEKDGLVQKEIEKADIVLELSGFGNWLVVKTPYVEPDNNFLWLKFPEVTLDELLVNNPKDIWVYVDHRQVNTNTCENMYHAFANHMVELGRADINLHLMSGHPPAGWTLDKEIVLMASPIGFFVDTARETPHTQKLVPKKELFGYDDVQVNTLTSQCRTKLSRESIPDINIADAYPKPGEPLDPNDDPGQFYRSGFGNEPLLPHEVPGQAYALSAQAEEARVQLELAEMSIKRFGYLLVYPDTGLPLSKEDQDKHVEDIISSVSKNKD